MSKTIKQGLISGLGRSYTIVEKDNGEIYCNTANSYFRVAKNYSDYTMISSSRLEQMIYQEETQGERNMRDLYGSSMGR